MAKTQFLNYYICLTDPDLVSQYQNTQWIPAVTVPGTIPLGVVNRAIFPNAADEEFSAPFRGFSQPSGPGPYIWTPWYGAGIPDDEDGPFPLNVATFQRKTGGFLGLGGTTVRYYWMGSFVYVSSGEVQTGPGVPAPPTNLAQVIWLDGAEGPGTQEGGAGMMPGVSNGLDEQGISRDASRHVDGLGWAVRGETATFNKDFRWDAFGVANPATGWVRWYWRIRKFPTAAATIWACRTSTEGTNALELRLTPTGTFAVYTRQSTVVSFLTSLAYQFELDRWYRMDCLMKVGQNPPNDGRFRLYINGNKEGDLNITTNEGLGGGGASPKLLQTTLGSAANVNGGAWDFDDASGHTFPVSTDDETFLGADFQNGSSIRLVRPRIFDGAAGSWVGAAESLQQLPAQQSAGGLASSTSGDAFQVTTDSDLQIGAVPGALGCTAILVGAYSARPAGAGTSQLGYSVAGAGPVMANITLAAAYAWDAVLYNPSFGAALPTNPEPVKLRYIKPADASAVTVKALQAQALLIGQFGAEDVPPWSDLTEPGTDPGAPPETVPRHVGIHNAPYPRTPWALQGLPPLAPFVIIAGTYTGNNLAQDLFLKIPAHFWRVRPLAADTGGVTWWSSMLGAHTTLREATVSEGMVQALMDPDFAGAGGEEAQQFQAIVRPSSTNVNANAAAASYAYIAVCDPGQRFMLNGAVRNQSALASVANPLVDPDFLPEFAWLTHEVPNNSSTVRMAIKGPGHGSDSWQVLTAAQQATAVSFGTGVLNTLTNANALAFNQLAFSLWRSDDQTGDPNNIKVFRAFQYSGDGAGGNRTINIPTPTGTCRPLYALIVPTNAGTSSYQRDHAHTTTSSTRIDTGASIATAIVGGGIDTILVGTTLNGSGVTYNVFVILAESAAGNGGWGLPGEYVPVEPDTAPGGQWSDPFPGEPVAGGGGGTIPPDLSTDLTVGCAPATLKVVNLALHLLGSSTTIADLTNDATREGETMRLLYSEAVEQVLRDHPWRFARRYATLAWVAGEADGDMATPDFRFSYRTPIDMVAARRLVRPELGRKFDPDPPPFTLMTDDTSEDRRTNSLLLSDFDSGDEEALDPEVELEYTARVNCPSGTGDALFRLALAWQLAHMAAPSLSRDEKRVDYCFRQYLGVLNRAQTADRTEAQEEPPGEASWMTARDGG